MPTTTTVGTTTVSSMTCSGKVGDTTTVTTSGTALIGKGNNTPSYNSVTIGSAATGATDTVVSNDRTVISLASGTTAAPNTITINGTVDSGGLNQGPDGIGGNAIEFGSSTNLTINKGGSVIVEATGSTNSEAINPTGYGNTITNYGLIDTKNNAADIWLQGSDAVVGTNNVNTIDNYGTITAGPDGTGSVIGNSDASVVHFTNESGATINGNITLGDLANVVTMDDGSVVNGNVDGGGSKATLVLTGATGADTLSGTVSGFGELDKDQGGTWTVGSATAPLTDLSPNLAVNVNDGTLILAGDTSVTQAQVAINGGTLQLGTGGTNGWISGITVDNGLLAFDRSDTNTFLGDINGTGALSQIGTGTTVLTGTNTYTGGTTISAGTLQIGDGGTTGSITGDVADAGTLAFDRSDVSTFDGAVSGTGALSQIGTGTTVLTEASTYTGGTNISAGTLQVGDGTTTGSITGDVADAGTLAFNRSDVSTFDAVVSGTGALSQIGTGTTVLTGTNTYTGGTNISAGTLQGNTNSFGTGGVAIASGGDLTLTNGGTFTNTLSGDGTLTKADDDSTLVVSGDGTAFDGATDVQGGALTATGTTLANSMVTVDAGATLNGNGTIGGADIRSGGTVSPPPARHPPRPR
ncbi:autotransporter-associated beta strand repeat-containing protein [Novacetimonas hansenii]|uniref:beta strand repeat-containing protein n=1 Tax=Novacetimonas hansenii TaxID=436 RepID=UPI00248DB6A0|nr:autotransporter-associated beta strand repeat-containing protein [Novacetimonas hansenii]